MKLKNITAIIALLVVLSGCSDFLYQEPDEQVSINEQFSTQEGLWQALNGMYKEAEEVVSSKYFVYADLTGGNLAFSPAEKDHLIEVTSGLEISNVYNFNDQSVDSDYESFYEYTYDVINAANLMLERLNEVPGLTPTEIDQVKAEVYAARAYSHFLLCQLYSQNYNYTTDASHLGVVYNTRTLRAGIDYPARKSALESYNLIKQDLETALSLFTGQPALNYGPEYSYFNEVNTKALYARIALHMNDWETALYMADDVINEAKVSLMDSSQYIREWEKPELAVSEVLFELTAPRSNDEEEVSSSVAHSYYIFIDSTDYRDFVASADLVNLYDSTDLRRKLFLIKELKTIKDSVEFYPSYYFTKKFQDDPGTLVMRLSELYLIRAEANARAQNGDMQQALTDLNTIRTRAGLVEITDPGNILEEIFLERRRELAFEGHLLFDIMRYQKNVSRGEDCLSSTCNLSYPSPYFVLPIPEGSVSLNQNMIQNEGY